MVGESLVREMRPDASNLHTRRARMGQGGCAVEAQDKGPEGIVRRRSTAYSLILGKAEKKCQGEDKNTC